MIDKYIYLCYNGRIMKRRKDGSTMKQYAYAVKRLSGEGKSRRQLALSVGYAESTANHPAERIESTEGYANAVIELANETGAGILGAIKRLHKEKIPTMQTDELLETVKTLTQAWSTFTAPIKQDPEKALPYKALLLQHVENQTIQAKPADPGDQKPLQE